MTTDSEHQEVLRILKDFNEEASSILTNESVEVYLFLKKRFEENKQSITKDHVFQFVFRSFYRLDNAGLGDEIKNKYFQLFEENATNENIDLKSICDELRNYKNLKGKYTMQFSFSTKMAATINESFPIYDSFVGKVFGFPPPYATKNWDKRYQEYSDFYQKIRDTVSRLIEEEEKINLMRSFDEKIANWSSLPEMKKYDFLFWSTGKAVSNQG